MDPSHGSLARLSLVTLLVLLGVVPGVDAQSVGVQNAGNHSASPAPQPIDPWCTGGRFRGRTFVTVVNPPVVGADVSSLITADIDADGDLDVLASNVDRDFVSFLSNRGNGAFDDPVTYDVGEEPAEVVSADLDGDGDLDVVTANAGSLISSWPGGDSISVLLARGDGTLAPRVDYETGDRPVALVVVDIDGDTDPDVLTANQYDDTFSVLFNAGDGSFRGRVDHPVGESPSSIACGDLDGDGDSDVVTADTAGDTVSVFLNQGDGNFAAPTTIAIATPRIVKIADMDSDGDRDILFTRSTPALDYAGVLLNLGGGTFAAPSEHSAGRWLRALHPADVDGDGDMDFLAGDADKHEMLVFLREENGTYGVPQRIPTSPSPAAVTTADIDGDGDPDALVGISLGGTMAVFPNPGDGHFESSTRIYSDAPHSALIADDFNGDGWPDVVTGGSAYTGTLSTLMNVGGELSAPTVSVVGTEFFDLVPADVDGDSDLDLLAPAEGTVLVLANAGDGSFAPPVEYEMAIGPPKDAGWARAVATDLDGDGDLDMVTTNLEFSRVLVRMNTGDGTFGGPSDDVQYSTGEGPSDVVALDVEADGDMDVVTISRRDSGISVLLNDGQGILSPPAPLLTEDVGRNLETMDVDRDGRTDLVAWQPHSGEISILVNRGDGTFGPPVTYATECMADDVLGTDVDRDGDLDLAISSINCNRVGLLTNRGDGTFDPELRSYAVSGGSFTIRSADVDLDGDVDLLTTATSDLSITVLFSQCP